MPDLAYSLVVFLGVAVFFLFVHLMMGKLLRPARPERDKLTIYECGEPTVGSAWVQFDLRYYVVALLFVIFDVEVAFFFPWAVVFGNVNALARPDLDKHERAAISKQLMPPSLRVPQADIPARLKQKTESLKEELEPETAHGWGMVAFVDIMIFFGVLMVGFAYLWKRGDINWVRSTAAERGMEAPRVSLPVSEGPALVASGKT
jgi:NADH-quinone oxidoreductase subunit A